MARNVNPSEQSPLGTFVSFNISDSANGHCDVNSKSIRPSSFPQSGKNSTAVSGRKL